MIEKPIPLIPKVSIRTDADVTALINEDGYILNSVHAEQFPAIVKASDVIGKHISDLYSPVPNEFIRALERAFEGESHWQTLTLPTVSGVGIIDRRFVLAYQPWPQIDGRSVALVRSKLLADDLTIALEQMKPRDKPQDQIGQRLRDRASYLISGDFSLDDVYIDALTDVVMKQSGFDAAMMVDEHGLVLDIHSTTNEPAIITEGVNLVEFMTAYEKSFDDKWQFMLEHAQYVNSIEEFPSPNGGTPMRILSRARVTRLKSDSGNRIVQLYVKKITPR